MRAWLCALLLVQGAVQAQGNDCAPPFTPPADWHRCPLIVLGELHGTREFPALAGELLCALGAAGRPWLLALEIAHEEQPAIDRYLLSPGAAADQRRLLAGRFWGGFNGTFDGRSSQAMLALIERVRQLRLQGRAVGILALDGALDELPRDAAMAARLQLARAAQPGAQVLALVGSVHASRQRGASFDPDFEPMAYHLRGLAPISVLQEAAAGRAWICRDSGCGDSALYDRGPGLTLGLVRGAPESGFTDLLRLPWVQASAPARQAQEQP